MRVPDVLVLLALATPLCAQEESEKPLNSRKLTPKELRRQTEEAFRDAAKAAESRVAWTARFRMTVSNPFEDNTVSYTGRVWVKKMGEEGLAFYWEREREKEKSGGEKYRALYRGEHLSMVVEKAGKMWRGRIDPARKFWFPALIREGFHKELTKIYFLDLYANAKYQKTEATHEDWVHLGFNSKEEFEEWWQNKKGTDPVTGITGDLYEHRPFREKEDEFDRKNPRKSVLEKVDGVAQKYYGLVLTPRREPLNREIRQISMTLRPGDFLPTRIYVERTNDFFSSIHFEEIQKDPEPEIGDDRFTIDETGLTIINEEE